MAAFRLSVLETKLVFGNIAEPLIDAQTASLRDAEGGPWPANATINTAGLIPPYGSPVAFRSVAFHSAP